MTLNEFSYLICGIIWGAWIIRPIIDIGTKIYKNAKEKTNE